MIIREIDKKHNSQLKCIFATHKWSEEVLKEELGIQKCKQIIKIVI